MSNEIEEVRVVYKCEQEGCAQGAAIVSQTNQGFFQTPELRCTRHPEMLMAIMDVRIGRPSAIVDPRTGRPLMGPQTASGNGDDNAG